MTRSHEGRMHRLGLIRRVCILAMAGLASGSGITASSARSGEPPRLIVLELFTSQGCSSCPPADALLRELSVSRADLLPLAFHVTYWNYLGWRDPFSFDAATERQHLYAQRLGASTIYTPQLVVDGTTGVVGSDRAGVAGALRRAATAVSPPATVSLRRHGDAVLVSIGAGAGAGTVYLVGYDDEHRTPVGRGENGGRTLVEANVVRSFVPMGEYYGTPVTLNETRPDAEHLAVFIQAADGRILGAARESTQGG